jgi:hypothetical protein
MPRRPNRTKRKLPRRAPASVSNSTTSPAQIEHHEKIAEAFGLRLTGLTFARIGSQMKISSSTAHGLVVEGLASTIREPAEHVLQLELCRLDELTVAVWPSATKGRLKAVEVVLALMERRAKYLGIEKPARMAFTDADGKNLPPPPANPPSLRINFTDDREATVVVRELQPAGVESPKGGTVRFGKPLMHRACRGTD